MHVLQHDFGGYPYPADLSRALAARGHRVTHAWCSSLETTPGGGFALRPADPAHLEFEAIDLGATLAKYSFLRRWQQERRYGRLIAELTMRVRPDVVISANTPLDAQASLLRACRRLRIPFIFWLQDLIGVAAHRLLSRKLPLVGAVVGRHYCALEARLLRESDAVISITDDFLPLLQDWGVRRERVTTVENWAPIAELPVRPKNNPWARAHGLDRHFVFLYAGTMGMKHDPKLIARLAEGVRELSNVRVVVLSQGPGADYLNSQRNARGLENLIVRSFEPFSRMSDVMGAADVLLAVLERDAGVFSVPSKVLAYLCGARPLLLAMPPENLASRIVEREGAGVIVAPDDSDGFLAGAFRLLEEPETRIEMGGNARRYAERAFDIAQIRDRFENVLSRVVKRAA